jgi:hypothetical protein
MKKLERGMETRIPIHEANAEWISTNVKVQTNRLQHQPRPIFR